MSVWCACVPPAPCVTFEYMCVFVSLCVCAHVCVCVCVCNMLNVFVRVCVYVCTYICMCVCVCVYIINIMNHFFYKAHITIYISSLCALGRKKTEIKKNGQFNHQQTANICTHARACLLLVMRFSPFFITIEQQKLASYTNCPPLQNYVINASFYSCCVRFSNKVLC